jgi:hypothetical protein
MDFGRINDGISRLIADGRVNGDIGIAVKSIPMQITSISPHAETRLAKRGITKKIAQGYIDYSEVMLKQTDNKGNVTQTYLSNDGVSAVVVENGVLKTAYSKEYFDPAIKSVFEVIENAREYGS